VINHVMMTHSGGCSRIAKDQSQQQSTMYEIPWHRLADSLCASDVHDIWATSTKAGARVAFCHAVAAAHARYGSVFTLIDNKHV
jgi:hypothetical protein